jgi:dinuclear metal center YbgI/SA1388 family protein
METGLKVGHVISFIEEWVSPSLARPGDNIGLQVGDSDWLVKAIFLSTDPTLAALSRALDKGANLVVSHHPLIFRPLSSLRGASEALLFAVKNDVAVYSAHTNLDVVKGGINDLLINKLGLIDAQPLKEGDLPAMGRLGELEKPVDLKGLAKLVQEKLGVDVRVLGDLGIQVKRVALCGGGGSSLLRKAFEQKADVFITGDVNHHAALQALDLGIAVIDATHLATERVILPKLKEYLLEKIGEKGAQIPVYLNEEENLPWWGVE